MKLAKRPIWSEGVLTALSFMISVIYWLSNGGMVNTPTLSIFPVNLFLSSSLPILLLFTNTWSGLHSMNYGVLGIVQLIDYLGWNYFHKSRYSLWTILSSGQLSEKFMSPTKQTVSIPLLAYDICFSWFILMSAWFMLYRCTQFIENFVV